MADPNPSAPAATTLPKKRWWQRAATSLATSAVSRGLDIPPMMSVIAGEPTFDEYLEMIRAQSKATLQVAPQDFNAYLQELLAASKSAAKGNPRPVTTPAPAGFDAHLATLQTQLQVPAPADFDVYLAGLRAQAPIVTASPVPAPPPLPAYNLTAGEQATALKAAEFAFATPTHTDHLPLTSGADKITVNGHNYTVRMNKTDGAISLDGAHSVAGQAWIDHAHKLLADLKAKAALPPAPVAAPTPAAVPAPAPAAVPAPAAASPAPAAAPQKYDLKVVVYNAGLAIQNPLKPSEHFPMALGSASVPDTLRHHGIDINSIDTIEFDHRNFGQINVTPTGIAAPHIYSNTISNPTPYAKFDLLMIIDPRNDPDTAKFIMLATPTDKSIQPTRIKIGTYNLVDLIDERSVLIPTTAFDKMMATVRSEMVGEIEKLAPYQLTPPEITKAKEAGRLLHSRPNILSGEFEFELNGKKYNLISTNGQANILAIPADGQFITQPAVDFNAKDIKAFVTEVQATKSKLEAPAPVPGAPVPVGPTLPPAGAAVPAPAFVPPPVVASAAVPSAPVVPQPVLPTAPQPAATSLGSFLTAAAASAPVIQAPALPPVLPTAPTLPPPVLPVAAPALPSAPVAAKPPAPAAAAPAVPPPLPPVAPPIPNMVIDPANELKIASKAINLYLSNKGREKVVINEATGEKRSAHDIVSHLIDSETQKGIVQNRDFIIATDGSSYSDLGAQMVAKSNHISTSLFKNKKIKEIDAKWDTLNEAEKGAAVVTLFTECAAAMKKGGMPTGLKLDKKKTGFEAFLPPEDLKQKCNDMHDDALDAPFLDVLCKVMKDLTYSAQETRRKGMEKEARNNLFIVSEHEGRADLHKSLAALQMDDFYKADGKGPAHDQHIAQPAEVESESLSRLTVGKYNLRTQVDSITAPERRSAWKAIGVVLLSVGSMVGVIKTVEDAGEKAPVPAPAPAVPGAKPEVKTPVVKKTTMDGVINVDGENFVKPKTFYNNPDITQEDIDTINGLGQDAKEGADLKAEQFKRAGARIETAIPTTPLPPR